MLDRTQNRGDALAAVPQQVPYRRAGGCTLRDPHRHNLIGPEPQHVDGSVRNRRGAYLQRRSDDQHRVHPPVPEGLQHLLLCGWVIGRRSDEHGLAPLGGLAFDLGDEVGEERAVEVGHQHPDGVRVGPPEGQRHRIGAIAELLDRAQYSLSSLLGHELRSVVDDVADSGRRRPGTPRDVGSGGVPAGDCGRQTKYSSGYQAIGRPESGYKRPARQALTALRSNVKASCAAHPAHLAGAVLDVCGRSRLFVTLTRPIRRAFRNS
ncbi:hypothetical protein SDC9_107708 [bioreactor metagenome]|uniref:Uncharacterized protein n=1 Tax=bioreactor metagenome TaxID=1076179 RepID=A0A645BGJ3_9ZZZZ